MTRYKVSNAQAEGRIANEEIFRTSWIETEGGHRVVRFSGRPGTARTFGQLPMQYRGDALMARYVVYSYGTPIGWIRRDGTKVVPDVGYSPTTGQHQYIVKDAWGIKTWPARSRELAPSGGGSRKGGFGG